MANRVHWTHCQVEFLNCGNGQIQFKSNTNLDSQPCPNEINFCDPTLAGEEFMLTCFFVQSILGDQYIHRRDLRVVLTESPYM